MSDKKQTHLKIDKKEDTTCVYNQTNLTQLNPPLPQQSSIIDLSVQNNVFRCNKITPRHGALRRSLTIHHHLLPHLRNPENAVSELSSQYRKRLFHHHHHLTSNRKTSISPPPEENQIGEIDSILNCSERSRSD